ncbi:MAG: homoaconitate hydratase [Thermoplasmatota archaeon]
MKKKQSSYDTTDSAAISIYNMIPEVTKTYHLPDEIVIYDSTLRDGEQMPGISFSMEQKIAIARKLDEIGIPEIEAGFPAVSKKEKETIKKITQEGLNAKILVLSRLKKQDIDAAIDSDADMILLFIASSPIHLQYKLHISIEEIKQKIVSSIDYVKDHGIQPSFSTEDSTRTPLSSLQELVSLAVETGATRIGFTDTVGCATPQSIQYLFSQMRTIVTTPFSAHLHNDFGLGLCNALSALSSGAKHICTTINGWGERAGNIPLEQLVMTLQILYNKNLGIDTSEFTTLSKMISDFTKIPIPPTQPFVGSNIFTHESGIHVAAVLENPYTYEPVTPTLVGNSRQLIIGKHSGKHIVKKILQDNNIVLDEKSIENITTEIKELAEKNIVLSQEEIKQLALQISEE